MSLLELMLATAITAMIAAAIAGMLGAVSSGVGTRRDNRTIMVLANAAESRLSAYIAPARCMLSIDKDDMVLWLNDSREGRTVHASELRWLLFDQAAGTIDVCYVEFPSAWTTIARELEDREYSMDENWTEVFNHYQANSWMKRRTLVDNLQSISINTDAEDVMNSKHFWVELGFRSHTETVPMCVASTIRQHATPSK